MCISKTINVVAIFGQCCSGKTYLTNHLSNMLQCPVRNCGESLKDLAKKKGFNDYEKLPDEVHEIVDSETKNIALRAIKNSSLIIVEGRYLHYVLKDINNVVFIKLICGKDERSRRLRLKSNVQGIISMDDIDESDIEFIKVRYGTVKPEESQLIMDTEQLDVEAICKRICDKLDLL